MTRLKRSSATDNKGEWTCGHVAGAVCAECYRQLAAKAHELDEENQRLRDELDEARCTHAHYDFKTHGRHCTCGLLMVDPGD